jgi:transposase-like protein
MRKHPFSRALEAYLRAKEDKGEPLPGIKGRVNYKGVSIESGIAPGYFKKGTPLRLLVDAWVEKLGLSNKCRTKQPRRPKESEVRIATTTYAELKACGAIWLRKHPYSEASVASYLSHLNTYMRHFGRTDEDKTADDLGDDFNQRLTAFLKATGKGKTIASVLRLWSRIHYEVHQSMSLSLTFAEALTDLVIDSGRSIADVARSAGFNHSTLWDWMSGDKSPTDPVQISKLEEALNVLPETLSSKLTFYGVRRSADIPKAWWPEMWQKYLTNYRHHRTRVIHLIPKELLSGTLEDLKPAFDEAVQKVLEGVGEPAHRRRTTKLTKKKYRTPFQDWPDQLKEEFRSLVEYKTASNGLRHRNRGTKWAEGTVPIVQEYLEAFFGFLCLPPEHPDPELRGLGLRPENLTLAWLTVQDAVESYLEFRFLRSGAHNGITESFVRTFTAQLQPDTGWLWLHPELLERLPEPQREAVEAAGGWQAYCTKTLVKLREGLACLQRDGEIRRSRDPMLPIWPILDHPEPLALVRSALARNRLDLEARAKPNQLMSWRLAAAWRDHVLISFLARFPLRSKHWSLLTYKEDGTGYLQNHHRDGWRLVIPYDDFKNVRNTKIFTLHSLERVLVLKFSRLKALQQLIPLLEFYLEHARPLLAGQSDFLFPSGHGKAMGRDLSYRQVSNWTREYLSQHSPRKLGIKDVFPFGPHAFRDIVATHIIKTTGDLSRAANILLDSEEMVREHYARFLPEDRVGLAMAELADIFEDEDDEEEDED